MPFRQFAEALGLVGASQPCSYLREVSVGPDRIRLLTLESKSPSELSCKVKAARLSEKGSAFMALSYAWGSAEKSKTISCNGEATEVSPNLFSALMQVWSKWPHCSIWCDFLCINQSSNQERNQQVAMMGRIYSSAQTVTIWLGPKSDDIAALWSSMQPANNIHIIRKRDNEPLQVMAKGPGRYPPILVDSSDLSDTQRSTPEVGETSPPNEVLRGQEELAQRAWFHRAWTFQETRLASNAVLLCGDLTISWAAFLQHWRTDRSGRDATLASTFTGAQSAIRSTLTDFLLAIWSRKATDPRDKVFSVLSPELMPGSNLYVRPNYSLTAKQTYIRATRACFYQDGHVKLLREFQNHKLRGWRGLANPTRKADEESVSITENEQPNEEPFQEIDLPSRVVDWRGPLDQRPTAGVRRKFTPYPRLHGDHVPENTLRWQDMSDFGDFLSVRGVALALLSANDRLSVSAFAFLSTYDSVWESAPPAIRHAAVPWERLITSAQSRQSETGVVNLPDAQFSHFKDAVDHHCQEDNIAALPPYGRFTNLGSDIDIVKSGDWLFQLDYGEKCVLRPVLPADIPPKLSAQQTPAQRNVPKFLFISSIPNYATVPSYSPSYWDFKNQSGGIISDEHIRGICGNYVII